MNFWSKMFIGIGFRITVFGLLFKTGLPIPVLEKNIQYRKDVLIFGNTALFRYNIGFNVALMIFKTGYNINFCTRFN